MRLLVAVFALARAPIALSTSIEPRPLSELVAEADYIFVGTVTAVDMVDGDGNQVTDPDARTGPGLPNQLRLHVRVDPTSVLRSDGDLPTEVVVPLWQMWHMRLSMSREINEGKTSIFLLVGDNFEPVYPACFELDVSRNGGPSDSGGSVPWGHRG
ncbi:MAG: hypothetical protein HYV07_06885 [Deltaproteobacteria bacterium]|nr:hypothetical protein [Deltaproteobacteria bacterium]